MELKRCEILIGGGHPGEHECGSVAVGETYDAVPICKNCAQGFVDNRDEDQLTEEVLRALSGSSEVITSALAEQLRLTICLKRGEAQVPVEVLRRVDPRWYLDEGALLFWVEGEPRLHVSFMTFDVVGIDLDALLAAIAQYQVSCVLLCPEQGIIHG